MGIRGVVTVVAIRLVEHAPPVSNICVPLN
jgi:hypothetical protein